MSTRKKSSRKKAAAVKSVTAKISSSQTSMVRTFSTVKDRADSPVYTGRRLVILNNQTSASRIVKQAKNFSLSMASVTDFAPGHEGTVVDKALEQADAIVFEKLKIAVVKEDKNEEVNMLTTRSVSKRNFIKSEPERFVYALALSAKRTLRASPLADSETATWGIQTVNALNAPRNGKGINIAILDTGFNLSHPDFAGRSVTAKSFISNQAAEDGNGHGTHCTGIAAGNIHSTKHFRYGVAGGANIFIGKVLSNKGVGTDGDILAGIEWAIQNKCRVISMSLGGEVGPGEKFSESYETAAQVALRNNCLIVAAAGNESNRPGVIKPVGHPANCPSIMAVAAVDNRMSVAWFSCGGINPDGGQVDIAGPGVDILSSWKNKKYKLESGTSMATPFVAGIATLLWEDNPKASAGEIWMKLTQAAKRLRIPSTDVGSGLTRF